MSIPWWLFAAGLVGLVVWAFGFIALLVSDHRRRIAQTRTKP
jgi:type VI protein secretion system component VasF